MTFLRSWLGIDRHMSAQDTICVFGEPVDQLATCLVQSHRHGVGSASEDGRDLIDGEAVPAPHHHDVAVVVAQ